MTISFWSGFQFLWPWMVAALPLPWIVYYALKPAAKNQTPLLAPHLIRRLEGHWKKTERPKVTAWQSIPWRWLLLWALLVLAAMRPVWFLTPTPFETSGRDLMLAVDLSGSMEKTDMRLDGKEVDRLTSVKSVASQFIAKRRGDRMGLIVFGSQAFLQSPLTYDLKTVNTLLQEAEIGMAGNNTAIGDAIGLTLKHFRKTRHEQAVLILLTDGSNTDGAVQPLDAALQAKQMGVKIYTIGIGQANMNQIDQFIFGVGRDMDVVTLKKIAELTGGQFFLASDTQKLNDVYDMIDALEKHEYQMHQYRLRKELYPWPLGTAFVLSLLFALMFLYRHYIQGNGEQTS